MRVVVVLLGACVVSCHLGETLDPPTCGSGTHPENGHCVADPASGPVITITAANGAVACGVSPASITVAPQAQFTFKNEDAVDHTITGADGKDWAVAKARQESPLIGITKSGSWLYTVSGCSAGGTVIVQ